MITHNMSVARARDNRAMLKVKQIRYPFVYRQEHRGLMRPEEFGKVFPSIAFCRIPVHKDVYWLFETALDMDMFKAWEKRIENANKAL